MDSKFAEEDILIQNFLMEIDSSSKSINHITKMKYHFVLDFWKKIALKNFNSTVKDLSKSDLRLIRHLMQHKKIEEVNTHVSNEKLYEASTIINYFSVLRSYYNFLLEEKIIVANPLDNLRLPSKNKSTVIFLDDNEIMTLVKKLKDSLDKEKNNYYQEILIILLPLTTGLRVIEQSELNMDSIDINSGRVRIIGKGSKQRSSFLPIHDAFFMQIWNSFLVERQKRKDEIINSLKQKNESVEIIEEIKNNEALFINQRGHRLSIRDIQRKVKHYRELFNIAKKLTPHKLRHSFASKCVRENVDIFLIKELLGHEKITTTEIYLHANEQILQTKMQEKKPFNFNFTESK